MNNQLTISLNKLLFFAYHGLYAEEKKIGAEYEINLLVSFEPPDNITSLEETVNYQKIYSLLKTEMKRPRELLETFVMEVTQAIHLSFPVIKKIEITITKSEVPVSEFTGNVSAKYCKEY